MKKTLCLILVFCVLFNFAGCGTNQEKDSDLSNNNLYDKAIAILDELGNEERVEDFRNAYNLLSSLPSSKDGFIKQLKDANKYFEKYGIELDQGKAYITASDTSWVSSEKITDYCTRGAYSDAYDLLQITVYPVLFEKYGNEAQCIKGITATNVISAINSYNSYNHESKEEKYDIFTEEWQYSGLPKSKYRLDYYKNGLVESVNIPIARSDEPMSDADYTSFSSLTAEEQKQFASTRFLNLKNQIKSVTYGNEVLTQIYSENDISTIKNYISSLSIDEIWENSLYTVTENAANNYYGAMLLLVYGGNSIFVNFGLNDIDLGISGRNYVNELSHRWDILWLGLTNNSITTDTLNTYKETINNNVSYNEIIDEHTYDLDANADKYAINTDNQTNENSDNENTANKTVEISLSDRITVEGYIERNSTDFPLYRLKLKEKLNVIFAEYGKEEMFICDYLFFYNDTQLNGDYPLDSMAASGRLYSVTAQLEDYRDAGYLYMLKPDINNAD